MKNIFKKIKSNRLLSSVEAYKYWSTFYDSQPMNVVLYLEEELFTEIISPVSFTNKKIIDIGCGTGRHWNEILVKKPAGLIGADSSVDMINKLMQKFPEAEVHLIENNLFPFAPDNSFDIIISTLTIGHVRNIEDYFKEWDRVLKSKGEIIITDFHPSAFSAGMKRTFLFNGKIIEVENYLYETDFLEKLFDKLSWKVITIQEKIIDEKVKFFFEQQNFQDAYKKYKDTPLITGIYLQKI